MGKLVKGWGINDADYTVKIKTAYYDTTGKRKFNEVWNCPYYERWLSILERSFSDKYIISKPSYKDVTTSEDWKYFSDFREWMLGKNWQGMQLDKDILVPGNKVYGPNTCAFVPRYINSLIVRGGIKTGLPIGVTYDYTRKDGTKIYASRISNENNKLTALGHYNSVQVAHREWQKEKARVIEVVVARYAKEPFFDSYVADALLARAWKLRTDAFNGIETIEL